ncbi:MAG: bifunctional precorrin-2 dehydrogenase/sirohydrochlorin ferrochelatase [Clostridia bacterium]|nr:bifunctional precorrin-2 dehydrogenase/sirohydrochlorin ferrochelatase [Clostridia bacterium]
MTLFPFFQNIENKTFLIVGGGSVAKEKLEKLQLFTNNIRIVATETDLKGATLRPFRDTDIMGADFVIGATNNREVNRHIYDLCVAGSIPVNCVDDPELCTFIFPSLVKKGDLVIGITTAGKAPAFGQQVRRILEEELPEDTEQIIDDLYAYKQQLKETIPAQAERSRLVKAYLKERLEKQ